jgi:hypothetical protein
MDFKNLKINLVSKTDTVPPKKNISVLGKLSDIPNGIRDGGIVITGDKFFVMKIVQDVR